jgi:hypothetical protein
MDRRSALIQLGITAGGILAFTACHNKDQKAITDAYSKLGISETEQNFVHALGESIIPSDPQVKGSSDLNLGSFVLLMVNDCMSQDDQTKYVKGLRTFKKSVEKLKLKDQALLDAITTGINGDENNPEEMPIRVFLSRTKEYLIQGFITSQYFMTEIMPYQMIPGKFNGKFEIPPNHKVNMYG